MRLKSATPCDCKKNRNFTQKNNNSKIENNIMKGIVIRNTGNSYLVRVDVGGTLLCKVKGNFRLKGIRTTNPVAVGDVVNVDVIADSADAFYITKVFPRRNYIIRRASNLSKESHIIAANVDCAVLIATIAHPTTATTFIDRFLVTAEAYGVPAVIVFNKVDLLDEELNEYLDAITYLYRSIGYKVIHSSAVDGTGIDTLREYLKDKVSLFAGNSGVGKTTLLNRLIPGIDAKTAEISEAHDSGMHTTTFSAMYDLPGGGAIIDTPGVRGFGTIDMSKEEVAHYFPEMFALSHECRFANCTHTHEPGCAVLAALDNQMIAQSRYTSYLSILEDSEQGKYRKPQ